MGNIRKPNRLPGYDYSTEGRYFVTICAKGHAALFGQVTVGPSIARLPEVSLSAEGKAVEAAILGITCHYPSVQVEQFVIMPNHVHILLSICEESRCGDGAPGKSRPTGAAIPQIVSSLKRFTNRKAGMDLWQGGYYDHIIRDEQDFLTRWQYIENNPAAWLDDDYYVE